MSRVDNHLNIFDDGIHYNFYDDWIKDWDYGLFWSGRNVGKSYSIKSMLALRAYKNSNHKFLYLRRAASQAKPKEVEIYYRNLPIEKIEPNYLIEKQFRSNKITLKLFEKDNPKQLVDSKDIGYIWSLSEADNARSGVFDDVDVVFFEEFTRQGLYLPNEISIFNHFISTVARSRKIRVVLVGNTVTRACPYFSKWGVEGVINQKIGTTQFYKFNDYGNDITLLSHYIATPDKVRNSMAFGESSKSIVTGAWETISFPSLPYNIKGLKPIYTCVFHAMSISFLVRLYYDKVLGKFWYITPKTTKIKERTRVFTDEYIADKYYSVGFSPTLALERKIFSTFLADTKYYANDLCGTDFMTCYKNLTRKTF